MSYTDQELSKFRDDFDKLSNGPPSHSQRLINRTNQICRKTNKNRFDACIAIINRLAKEVDHLDRELLIKA